MDSTPPSDGAPANTGAAGRPAPSCPECDTTMEFESGHSTHDLWAERFVCPECGTESYRTYGRGSV